MQCPACKRDVPMSFKCRACGAPLARTSAPPPGRVSPTPRATPPSTAPSAAPPAPSDAALPVPPRSAARATPDRESSAAPEAAPLNPYAAPARQPVRSKPPTPPPVFHELGGGPPLAGRGARLVAQILDVVLAGFCIVPGYGVLILAASLGQRSAMADVLLGLGVLTLLAGALGLLVYQIRLLAREGQTWGKKQMRVRIVLYSDATIPGLGRTLGLRMFINNAIGSIPCLGVFYALADILFIFGPERRCLHDFLAGTKVVEAG